MDVISLSGLILSGVGALLLAVPNLPDSKLKFTVYYCTPPVRKIVQSSRGFLGYMTPGDKYDGFDRLGVAKTPKWAQISEKNIKEPKDWRANDWEARVLYTVASSRSWRWRKAELTNVSRQNWAEAIQEYELPPEMAIGNRPMRFLSRKDAHTHILAGDENSEDWILSAEEHAISGFYTSYGVVLLFVGFLLQIVSL